MRRTRIAGPLRIATPFVLAFALFAYSPSFALANVSVTTISTDPFTNTGSFHATEVEPDTFSFGTTVVAAFQTGRFRDGGASDVGWATTTDGGTNWAHGTLPGTTTFSTPARVPTAASPTPRWLTTRGTTCG